ncbi:hypothetical protein ACQB60_44835 [Actinomycetota bacterium Odt1-20B]
MAVETGTGQDERVTGRVWTVRLDPYGRPSAGTAKLSCSRPACADQHFPGGAAGRKAAVAHVNTHLAHIRTGGGPRGTAWCACRTADCAWHTPDPGTGAGRRPANRPVGCGGPVVLALYADRTGRLWRIAETCAKCAAATAGCRVLDTAVPPTRTVQKAGAGAAETERAGAAAGEGITAVFSDQGPSPTAGASSSEAAERTPLPRARTAASRRPKRSGKIAQRTVPHDLEPDVLRIELIELGDAFRTYQQRSEPDLVLLAGLQERKARAFALWADVTGDPSLRQEAQRAQAAAQTTLAMHHNRGATVISGGDGKVVERQLTRTQAEHARTVLDYVTARTPRPEPGVHLAVLMLTLRAARAGTGNITGQDLTGWLHDDAEPVLDALVADGWLTLPATTSEVMATRPENPCAFTVPTLLPDQPSPLTFGKTHRARISGWAQKIIGDRKIRKKKPSPATKLLAFYTAAHTRPDGRLGPAQDDGLGLEAVAAFCGLPAERIAAHTELLLTADWFTEAGIDGGRLRGQLAERVLPLGGLL